MSRMVLYTYDSYGLGHIARARAMVFELAKSFPDLEMLIVSGCTHVGHFTYPSKVDFIRLPGIPAHREHRLETIGSQFDYQATMKLRQSILLSVIDDYRPNLFYADREPLGINGELKPVLERLKHLRIPTVFGIRDIIDSPEVVQTQWEQGRKFSALEAYYERVWIFGVEEIYCPFAQVSVPPQCERLFEYLGYLGRSIEQCNSESYNYGSSNKIVVTVGGGGDGADVIRCVLKAYFQIAEALPELRIYAGPFASKKDIAELRRASSRSPKIKIMTFSSDLQKEIRSATGVVSMAGYNSVCELLAQNKRAILVPRRRPRAEQWIRAKRFRDLGALLAVLPKTEADVVGDLRDQLGLLLDQTHPSSSLPAEALSGLKAMARSVRDFIS